MEYQYFRIEPRSVIFERFEGEVIAINLDRGTYYSLNPAAADIFELVAGQAARADIIAALEHKYSAGTGTIRDEVTRFLQTLEAALRFTSTEDTLNNAATSRRCFSSSVACSPLAVSTRRASSGAPIRFSLRASSSFFITSPRVSISPPQAAAATDPQSPKPAVSSPGSGKSAMCTLPGRAMCVHTSSVVKLMI